jgi:hypothetical protein
MPTSTSYESHGIQIRQPRTTLHYADLPPQARETRSLGGADLDKELEVDVVGLGRGALGLLVPPAGDEVDTLRHDAKAVVRAVRKRTAKRGPRGEMEGRGSYHGGGGASVPAAAGCCLDSPPPARGSGWRRRRRYIYRASRRSLGF